MIVKESSAQEEAKTWFGEKKITTRSQDLLRELSLIEPWWKYDAETYRLPVPADVGEHAP